MFVYVDCCYCYDVGDGSEEMFWILECDGWCYLYFVSMFDGMIKQIIKVDWLVCDVFRVDDEKCFIWFLVNGIDVNKGKDFYFKYVFCVSFDGLGFICFIIVDVFYEVVFLLDMFFYVDIYFCVDFLIILELYCVNGFLVEIFEIGDIFCLFVVGFKVFEVFVVKGCDNSIDIWGLIVCSYDYDLKKIYFVIENIYVGLYDSFVFKIFWFFGYYLGGDKVIGMQVQVDFGFIVV